MVRPRIAVIGAGWWATQHHIPSLLGYPDAELVGVADTDPAKLAAVREHFGLRALFPDHQTMLREVQPDGAVVALPHALHASVSRDVLEAGVHLMVEKPMTLRVADALDLVALAQRRRLHLMVGYPWNHTRHADIAREVILSGSIGEPELVTAVFASMVIEYLRGNPEAYRAVFQFPVTGPGATTYSDPALAGGGQGHLQLTHTSGLLLWITGLQPREVFARMANLDARVDVIDALSVRFSNGALGTLASTGNIAPGQGEDHEIRVYGSGGALVMQPLLGRLHVRSRDGTARAIADLEPAERYPAEVTARALADIIAGRAVSRAPGELGAAVVALLEAAYESAASGRSERAELVPAS